MSGQEPREGGKVTRRATGCQDGYVSATHQRRHRRSVRVFPPPSRHYVGTRSPSLRELRWWRRWRKKTQQRRRTWDAAGQWKCGGWRSWQAGLSSRHYGHYVPASEPKVQTSPSWTGGAEEKSEVRLGSGTLKDTSGRKPTAPSSASAAAAAWRPSVATATARWSPHQPDQAPKATPLAEL